MLTGYSPPGEDVGANRPSLLRDVSRILVRVRSEARRAVALEGKTAVEHPVAQQHLPSDDLQALVGLMIIRFVFDRDGPRKGDVCMRRK